jgi:cellulose synthase/poly-beta-1,6-N-acetylglucosamine synthase-like glycosyltransferase
VAALALIFWSCMALLAWTYAGYPLFMLGRAALVRPPSPRRAVGAPPKVTVVVAARNAAGMLRGRVANLLAQRYPASLLDIVLAVNGSNDGTEDVARRIAAREPRVRLVVSPAAEGKAGALNRGVHAASGQVVVFADVRQRFGRRAVRRLAAAVMLPGVGAVTGRLVMRKARHAAAGGIDRYWSMETALRKAEARTGSVVGATGAIYAIRRALFEPIPPGTILDDVYVPLGIALRGHAVKMAAGAVAFDQPPQRPGAEYRRRVRTLLGNIELVRLLPDLIVPWRNPLFFRFVSHKLLRVASPVLFLLMLTTGLLLDGPLYHGVAYAQLAVCTAGALGLLIPMRLLAVPSAFLLVQTAALEALVRPRRRAADIWTP